MWIRQDIFALAFALVLIGCAKPSSVPDMDRRQANSSGTNVIPLVIIDDVPLRAAIQHTALQAGLNCLFTSSVPGADFNPSASSPEVYIRWENFTIEQVLSMLLDQHNLIMVTNFDVGVFRIACKGDTVLPATPISRERFENNPVPEIVIKELPLLEAIRRLATEAEVDLVLDRNLSAAPFKLDGQVSFRWRNVRPLDGLIALTDNYGLALVEETNSSAIRLTVKRK
jgi:hypothetical protein